MKLKNIIILAGISVLTFGLLGCGTGSEKEDSKTKWSELKVIEEKESCYAAGFYSKDIGLRVGYNGAVSYTTDSGDNWENGVNKSKCRFGLDIINEKVAYNCGNGGHVRKTTDGGANWTAVADFGQSEPLQCRHMSFISENEGWIAGPNNLGFTQDGGTTWKEIKTLPSDIGDILSIYYLKSNYGYVVDSKGKLYITSDGGDTWTTKELKVNDINNLIVKTITVDMHFSDEKNGDIYYLDTNNKLKAISTSDGGDTWTNQLMPDKDGEGLYLNKDGNILTVLNSMGFELTVLEKE